MTAANPVTLPLAGYQARHVRFEVAGKVATLTLDRPDKKNPLTFESYAEVVDIFRAAARDKGVKAIVVTGSGGNFCSGGDVKRQKLVERYAAKRAALMAAFDAAADPMERLEIHRKIQGLPRNSAKVRLRNRCWATGKPRGVYRDFGLCRNQLRERAHKGELPGVVKSSW